MDKTQAAWMKIVKPVAAGLVVLMAAGANALQYKQSGANDKMEARLTALEVELQNLQPWRGKVDTKMDTFEYMLSDIRSDVSFIRGKMEVVK